jgi:hypothetical protein
MNPQNTGNRLSVYSLGIFAKFTDTAGMFPDMSGKLADMSGKFADMSGKLAGMSGTP